MVDKREIKDPRALRAIAHPVRVRLAEELLVHGAATATQLGERIGESAANCSWHLRQLARYGWVEEAGGGTGRQRPWRLVPGVRSWGDDDADPELNLAADAATEVLLDAEVAALKRWEQLKRMEPPEWRRAAFTDQCAAWLTVDELAELNARITELVLRYAGRLSPESSPPDARPVRMVAWGVPVGPVRPSAAGCGAAGPADLAGAAGMAGAADTRAAGAGAETATGGEPGA